MLFEKDWFMRQIEAHIQAVSSLLFGKETALYEIRDEADLSQTDLLSRTIKRLLSEQKFCEAEDLLFEALDPDDDGILLVALDFYRSLNTFSDEALSEHQFSRAEIEDGLGDVLRRYHVEV